MRIMTDGSTIKTISENGKAAVIKPWLSGGLVVALIGNIVLSGVLILGLGSFEDTKRQAQEAEATIGKARTELTSLQVEVDFLKKQKEVLAPTIADWDKRLKEKSEAEAALTTLESKRRQTETDIAQDIKRLEDSKKNLLDIEKQKSELNVEIEKLKTEYLSLTKRNTDADATLRRALEAERRLNEAQNGITNTDTRRKQLEADVADAQKHFDQIQKEADDAREARKRLDDEATKVRQEIQSRKDEQTALEPKVSDLKTRQATVQQEEQKLAKLQQQVSIAEVRLNEIEERQRRATSESEQITSRLEKLRKEVTEWDLRRNSVKTEVQQADSDLGAARKRLQEISTKHDDLVRESSRLETAIERLKKEKETLEKELGRLEGEMPKRPTSGQRE